MKSYYVELTGINQSHLAEEEIDENNLKENEILIANHYSMISAGTELSRAFALKKGFEYPVRLGYCSVGEVIKKGAAVNDVEIGDLIFHNGAHASLSVRHQSGKTQGSCYFKLPKGIDEVQATSVNLGLITVSGINLASIKLGDTVAVFGLGNIGLITALLYKKMGCRVICVDPVEKRCQLALKMGLNEVVSDKEQLDAIKKIAPEGVDIAVDATGVSPVIMACVSATKRYGQVILLGSPRTAFETDITPMLNAIHMKNIQMIGAFNQTAPVEAVEGSDNSVHKNFNTFCNLIMAKDVDISKLISQIMDPKDCQKAYYGLMYEKDQYNCVVFDWSKYSNKR